MRAPSRSFSLFLRCGAVGVVVSAVTALSACGSVDGGPPLADPTPTDHPALPPPPKVPTDLPPASCDATITVASDSQALVVTDPAILEAFGLDRVLGQLITLSGASGVTPEAMMKRLFDTENDAASAVFPDNIHCDDVGNSAFKNGAATDCPRAEGKLASSAGLFTPGDKDYFVPVALVNRFDLANQGLSTCGEQRIVYAKWSGRTDPNDRLFVIFEGALTNPHPGDLMGCTPVAQAWQAAGNAASPAEAKAILEKLYFTGLPDVMPLVHPDHFGVHSTEDDPYGASHGQVRVSQRMQDPWELREYRILYPLEGEMGAPLHFAPTTVKNNPRPELFDMTQQTEIALGFRQEFVNMDLWNLSQAPDLAHMRMRTSNLHNAGESAVGGAAAVDYVTAATNAPGTDYVSVIQDHIDLMPSVNEACPPEDPLTGESVVRRAAALTCAGCHAPEKFLGPERKLGCGMTFPTTLGEVHIDENGALSPALLDVFLPRRAEILETYLQACDMSAIYSNLEPMGDKGIPK